jgi:uncharacterized protein (TIGR04141 family)
VIEKRIEDLLAEAPAVTLPSWPVEIDEGAFNHRIAEGEGYVHLDKDTIHTSRFRGGGLEIADVLGPRGELICVKKASKTEPLAHLFAQARVAAETLKRDPEAREKLVEKLPNDHAVDRRFPQPDRHPRDSAEGRDGRDTEEPVRLRQGAAPAHRDVDRRDGREAPGRLDHEMTARPIGQDVP